MDQEKLVIIRIIPSERSGHQLGANVFIDENGKQHQSEGQNSGKVILQGKFDIIDNLNSKYETYLQGQYEKYILPIRDWGIDPLVIGATVLCELTKDQNGYDIDKVISVDEESIVEFRQSINFKLKEMSNGLSFPERISIIPNRYYLSLKIINSAESKAESLVRLIDNALDGNYYRLIAYYAVILKLLSSNDVNNLEELENRLNIVDKSTIIHELTFAFIAARMTKNEINDENIASNEIRVVLERVLKENPNKYKSHLRLLRRY